MRIPSLHGKSNVKIRLKYIISPKRKAKETIFSTGEQGTEYTEAATTEVLYEKMCSQKFRKIHRKITAPESPFK